MELVHRIELHAKAAQRLFHLNDVRKVALVLSGRLPAFARGISNDSSELRQRGA